MANFPDFIIIGGMKCGTTVLWHNLNQHPAITMCNNPEDPKETSTEIRFWNNGEPYHTWKKGIDWYKNLFPDHCCGEKCANYIEDKLVFERMAKYAPYMQLILCVRNPIFRAYSEYQMSSVLRSYQHLAFRKKFKNDAFFRSKGEYKNLIEKNVLPYFSKEQLFIVIQERMKKDTNAEMNKIYKMLGVPELIVDTQEISFKDKDKKTDKYKSWTSNYPLITILEFEELEDYYKEHNEKFFEFLGYEIEEWQKPLTYFDYRI